MRRALTLLVLAAVLTGCGLKGPLYMPGTKPPPRNPPKQGAPAPTTPPTTTQDTNP